MATGLSARQLNIIKRMSCGDAVRRLGLSRYILNRETRLRFGCSYIEWSLDKGKAERHRRLVTVLNRYSTYDSDKLRRRLLVMGDVHRATIHRILRERNSS